MSAVVTQTQTIQLHPAQARFLDSSALYRGFVGGRGAGKTFVGAYDLLRRARPGRLYMVLAPTYTMLKDACWRTFLQAGERLRFIQSVNRSDLRVTLGNGAEVLFRSADEPDRLRGPNLTGAWLDEASVMGKGVYETIIACLRQAGEQGWLSCTFTPKGQSHWTYEVFGTGRPDVELVHATTYDNPFLAEGFERALREQYGAELAEQELAGEFVDLEGGLVVVPLALARRAEQVEYTPGTLEVIACDVAWRGHDQTVIVSRRGRVVRTLWKVRGQDLMQTVGMLAALHQQNKAAHLVVDAVGVGGGVVSRLRELGIGVIAVQGGAAADDSGRFMNKITELWWRMREAYEQGIQVEPDARLRSQVSSRHYQIKSDRRLAIESKERMAAEGRHSPDECLVPGTLVQTSEGSMPIEQIERGTLVWTRAGLRPVTIRRQTNPSARVYEVRLSNGCSLTGTAEHLVWAAGCGFVPLHSLAITDILEPYDLAVDRRSEWLLGMSLSGMGSPSFAGPSRCACICETTTGRTIVRLTSASKAWALSIARSIKLITARFLLAGTFITKTRTRSITHPTTWRLYLRSVTVRFTRMRLFGSVVATRWLGRKFGSVQPTGMVHQRGGPGMLSTASWPGRDVSLSLAYACNAAGSTRPSTDAQVLSSVHRTAVMSIAIRPAATSSRCAANTVLRSSSATGSGNNASARVSVLSVREAGRSPVHNLHVAGDCNEFFASGVLVHNSDALAMTFVLDYQLTGTRLSLGSDAPEREEHEPDPHSARRVSAEIAKARGTQLTPWSESRWGPLRRGTSIGRGWK